MKALHFIFALVVLALVSCNQSNNNEPKAIEISNLDSSVSPKDNFYSYVNNVWMKNNPIPGKYSRYGRFDKLNQENDEKTRELLIDLSESDHKHGTIAQMIADFYNSGMDSAAVEILGVSPLKDEFERISNIKDINNVMDEVARLHMYSIFPIFSIYSDQDPKSSENVIAFLSQDGLGLPDRDYYTDQDDHMKAIRTSYLQFIQNMLGFMGVDKSEAMLQSEIIMKIETSLAEASMTRLELRDPFTTYNKMSVADLQKLSPNINWKNYFEALGLENPGNVNVMQTKFIAEASKMLNSVSINDWKVYLRWSYYNSMADYLSQDVVNENFNFYEKVLSGSESIKPRWERVVDYTNDQLGMGLGKIYVEKYFPPQAKERMLKLVDNLRWSLNERITKLSWMSDSTKQKALEKLAAINVKIGYPDKWRDYTGLEIANNTLFVNVLNCSNFEMKYTISRINKPVDKTEWLMPPQTVNAYYNPSTNDICFPAGILQPPFFYLNEDDAVNYGAIGVVIGHEITHGFDDQGRQYDKVGNLNDWWAKSDADAFNSRAQIVIDQYNKFVVLDTIKADGNLTIGENLADLGGLNISFTALLKALQENNPGEIDGLTPSQRFYISYAKIWAQNIRDKEKLKRTKEDVHSLGEFRVNGPLPNIAEFLAAFNIQKGDSMFLPEEERAVIW